MTPWFSLQGEKGFPEIAKLTVIQCRDALIHGYGQHGHPDNKCHRRIHRLSPRLPPRRLLSWVYWFAPSVNFLLRSLPHPCQR